MSQYITFIIILAVVLVGIVIAFLRIRKYSKKEKLHQELSDKYAARGSYVNEKNFKLYGRHRDYRIGIESFQLGESVNAKNGANSLKFYLPMTNPMRKCLRILKEDAQFPELAKIVPLDKLLGVKHDLGDWLKIHTNDLVFSSLVLSENARISIHDALQNLPAGAIMFIQDEELACVVPGLLRKKEQLTPFYKLIDTLADMKDELN